MIAAYFVLLIPFIGIIFFAVSGHREDIGKYQCLVKRNLFAGDNLAGD